MPPELPLLLTVSETARLLALSRAGTYAAIARGTLPSIRVGSSVRVPRQGLLEWITSHTAGVLCSTSPPSRNGEKEREAEGVPVTPAEFDRAVAGVLAAVTPPGNGITR